MASRLIWLTSQPSELGEARLPLGPPDNSDLGGTRRLPLGPPDCRFFREFLQSTPNWGELQWQLCSSWLEVKDLDWEVLVMPLWIASGLEGFWPIDALQACSALEGKACYLVLSEEQQELALKVAQANFQGVYIRHSWGPGPWQELANDILLNLKRASATNPLQDCHEVLLARAGQVQLAYQSHDPDLRADLLSFLELKSQSISGLLGWGEPDRLKVGGGQQKTCIQFFSDSTLMLHSDARGLEPADWELYKELRRLGVEPR